MRIEIIERVERLFEMELAWDELYKVDTHGHFYLSPDFMMPIALRTEGQFRILAAWSDDGLLQGLLPLFVTTRWSKAGGCLYNVLDMLGHVFDADYSGILCDPVHEPEICHAMAQSVAGMPMGRVILNYFSATESRLDAFLAGFDTAIFDHQANTHLINDGQTNNLVCPYIDLPDCFTAYLDSLSANTRQKIRRLMRQLDNDPALKITRARPETYTQDVSILSKLWFLKHAPAKGEKRANRLAELFKETVMLGLASGRVYLAILWKDGKPVAAQANYIDMVRREALFHVAGRDDRIKDLSGGLLLQAHCIRWAIANGLKRFDFTIGDEAYKYSLGAKDRTIRSAEVFTRSGVNVGTTLDEGRRADVLKTIKQLHAKGRLIEAKTATQQALDAWPDLADNLLIKKVQAAQ